MEPGDMDFAAVVGEYTGMAYRVAFRLLGSRQDAEDAVQQSFVKLYRNRAEFSEEKNLRNWIYTITLNTARDIYRKSKRQIEVQLSETIPGKQGQEGAEDREYGAMTQQMLACLSGVQKEMVVLYYIEERPVKEISEILNVSESSVKVNLFRARKKILREFGGSLP